MRLHWLFILVVLSWAGAQPGRLVFGQGLTTTLSGHVTDAATGKPLPFANVYLDGTTHGNATDDKGYFTLSNVPLGTVDVVTSFLGYKTEKRTIRLDDANPRTINFRLKPDDRMLAGVTVKASRKDKGWERQLREFKRQILGPTFGGQCLLVNSYVLNFTEQEHHLQATATGPLIIENQALGYRLFYDLQYFDFHDRHVHYAGAVRFEELTPADERQANRFRRNRLTAYHGSLRHLMASLADSTYEKEGFLVYLENPNVPLSTFNAPPTLQAALNRHLLPLRISELILPGKLPFERRLVSSRQFAVFYTGATSSYSPYRDARYAYSQLWLPNRQMQFTTDGWITLPNGLEVEGSLADDRLSTMLPADWKPDRKSDASAGAPDLTSGKLLPPDARIERVRDAFTKQFQYLSPTLFAQIDKPFYATGDRLWLSAYLLDAPTNRLPIGETAVQADVLNATGNLVQHQWLRVTDGRATGDFKLSDSLASGTYRLRVYTDEDQSQPGPAFERTVAVYNLLENPTSIKPDTAGKSLDVQVLPEGGRWVAGLPARLGIKVTGPDGRGRPIAGRIVDSLGTELARFSCNQFGMGHVTMTPQAGRRYYVAILQNRQNQLVLLPPVEPTGLVLSADAVSDTNRLIIRIAGSKGSDDDPVYVLIQQRGRIVGQQKIQLQNGTAQFTLPVATLPAGLLQITLYDGVARPRAERLVFLPDRLPPVRLLMASNKPLYKPREQVILNLNVSDDGQPAQAALSASIADAGQVPHDSAVASMQTHLLLTGELRGRVEQPDFYLRDSNSETRLALDDLLLTQGWRRVHSTDDAGRLGGVSVKGQVLNAKNEPVPAAQVVLASVGVGQEQAFMRSAGANEQGRFRLGGLPIADTMQVLVQLMNREFKNLTEKEAQLVLSPPGMGRGEIIVDTIPDWVALNTQLQAARIRQDGDPSSYRDRTVKVLKEVTVRARKRDARSDDIRRMSLHSDADATVLFDDKSTRYANLYEMLRGRVPGVVVSQSPPALSAAGNYQVFIRGVGTLKSSTQPLFLMDGMPIQGSEGTELLPFNPGDIERIEVLKNAGTAGIYGVRGGNGVIAFYSKSSRTTGNTTDKTNTKAIPIIGYPSIRREFYMPRYDAEVADRQPDVNDRLDRRDVLYWKPLIQTDRQGHATLSFPLSDVARTLRITVQGVTGDGRPVSYVKLLRVQ